VQSLPEHAIPDRTVARSKSISDDISGLDDLGVLVDLATEVLREILG